MRAEILGYVIAGVMSIVSVRSVSAQTIATTVTGKIRIVGGDIEPGASSIDVRRAQVVLHGLELGGDGITAFPFLVGITFTDDEGTFTFTYEASPTAPPTPLALSVSLLDRDGLLAVYDQEESPDHVACLITRYFTVSPGETKRADIDLTIGAVASDDATHSLSEASFEPDTREQCPGAFAREKGATNVGAGRFPQLAVMYTRVQKAALYVKDGLRVDDFPLVRVQGWEPDKSAMSYGSCNVHSAIHVGADASPTRNASDAETNIFNLRHEYGHHFFCHSSIAGVADDASDHDHIDEHAGLVNHTSGDSWNEGFASYFAAAVSEWAGEDNPALLATASGYVDLTNGGMRLDDPHAPGWQPAFGALGEELAIAGLLWDVHAGWLGRVGLWNVLRTNEPDLETFKAVYDALHAAWLFPPDVCTYEGTASGLDCVFIDRGFYHDLDADGRYDTGDLVGVTRWPTSERPSSVERPNVPVIPGSELLLSIVDDEGTAVQSARLAIRIQYDPPLAPASFEYERALSGEGPHRVALAVPGNPSRAVVRAFDDEGRQSAPLTIESAFFHERINPYRDDGVADVLLTETLVVLAGGCAPDEDAGPCEEPDLDAGADASAALADAASPTNDPEPDAAVVDPIADASLHDGDAGADAAAGLDAGASPSDPSEGCSCRAVAGTRALSGPMSCAVALLMLIAFRPRGRRR